MDSSCELDSTPPPPDPNQFNFEPNAMQHTTSPNIDETQIHINTKYLLDDGRSGMCVFVGHTFFARGIWIGLVFENDGDGNCNGTINNKQYFLCEENRGLFVRKEKIIQLPPNNDGEEEEEKEQSENEECDSQYLQALTPTFFDHSSEQSVDLTDILNKVSHSNDDSLSLPDMDSLNDLTKEVTGNTTDELPIEMQKLNDFISSQSMNDDDENMEIVEDDRRISMMETFEESQQIIALSPIRGRMKMYFRSNEWNAIEFEEKDKNENVHFLSDKPMSSMMRDSANKGVISPIVRKLGPIELGRIEYNAPLHKIKVSPYAIEKYKPWYHKSSKQQQQNDDDDIKEDVLTDDVANNKNVKKILLNGNEEKEKKINYDSAWIEEKFCLVPNVNYNKHKNMKRMKKSKKCKKKRKKKRKQRSKSTNIDKKDDIICMHRLAQKSQSVKINMHTVKVQHYFL